MRDFNQSSSLETQDLLSNLEFERETRRQESKQVEALEAQIESIMQKQHQLKHIGGSKEFQKITQFEQTLEATYLLSQKNINDKNFKKIKELFSDISESVREIKDMLEKDDLEHLQQQSLKQQKTE